MEKSTMKKLQKGLAIAGTATEIDTVDCSVCWGSHWGLRESVMEYRYFLCGSSIWCLMGIRGRPIEVGPWTTNLGQVLFVLKSRMKLEFFDSNYWGGGVHWGDGSLLVSYGFFWFLL